MQSDFQLLSGQGTVDKAEAKKRKLEADKGETRAFLKIFETLPAQLLNAYGEARYAGMTDRAVWDQLVKPLNSGAQWMTEFAAKEAERRGIGFNRWALSVKVYMEYQNKPEVKKYNDFILKPELFASFYEEVDRILPSITYCLAPRKFAAKEGAANLRSSAPDVVSSEAKDPAELARHGKILYEWLDRGKVSRVRMLLEWQSCGGLSHVAATHHRAAAVFKGHGETFHVDGGSAVSLEDWQAAILARHAAGDAGMSEGEAKATVRSSDMRHV
jgi:hypothetical protein